MQKLSSSLSLTLRLRSSAHRSYPVKVLSFCTSGPSPHDVLTSYFVTKRGFSPDEAAHVSDFLVRRGIQSPDHPDSIISLFKSHGLDDSQLRRLFTRTQYTWWLAYKVEHFSSKLQSFRELGFTGDDLGVLISTIPCLLDRMDFEVIPMLKLWKFFIQPHSALMKNIRMPESILHNSTTVDLTVENAFQLHQLSEWPPTKPSFLIESKHFIKYSLSVVLGYLEEASVAVKTLLHKTD